MGRRLGLAFALALLGLACGGGTPAQAARIVGLTVDNLLVTFDSASPGATSGPVTITGLGDDTIAGIDYRPATGTLYGVGVGGVGTRLYIIDPSTGTATLATSLTDGSNGPITLGSSFAGVDFNPVPDRLRITTPTDQNLRVNVDTGVTTTDTPLAFAPGDVNFGQNPNIVGLAYTNNFAGATSTTLYGIDSNRDALVLQGSINGTPNSPNGGQLTTVGPLGFNTGDLVGFDITTVGGVNTAFASLTAAGGGPTRLFNINLATGAATEIGPIGNGLTLRGIAVAQLPEPSGLALIVSGGAGLLVFARRRRPSAA